MTKKNVLKLAMTVMAVFMFTAAMGQGTIGDYDLVGDGGDSYVTHEAAISLYALPDPVYNPSWSDFGDAINANSLWTWSVVGGWTWGTELTLAQTDNYVEITGNTIGGPYQVSVAEGFNGAGGLCEDGTPRLFNVHVLGKPTAGIVGAAVNNTWAEITAGYEYSICNDALAEDLVITITETGVPAALASYAYSVEMRVVNIDISDVEDGASETLTTLVDQTVATKYATATAGGGSETVSTGAMPVVGGERTKYEFTIKSATDYLGAGGEGIISGISHKSDYLAVGDITTYPFTGTTTITYIVNPAPSTGPIYHIPNDFSL